MRQNGGKNEIEKISEGSRSYCYGGSGDCGCFLGGRDISQGIIAETYPGSNV